MFLYPNLEATVADIVASKFLSAKIKRVANNVPGKSAVPRDLRSDRWEGAFR